MPAKLREAIPADLRDAFEAIQASLRVLIESLEGKDWARPTACPGWTVADVVAHLLDGDLRRLSLARDGHVIVPTESVDHWDGLVGFLDRLNREWVVAARRLSPTVLRLLHGVVGPDVVAYFRTLELDAPAAFPVAWAGEHASTHRFDIAREYTEKWIHQQQVREACGRPGATAPDLLHPLLSTLVHALPRAYTDVAAETGTAVQVDVEGPAGGTWTVRCDADRWRLYDGADGSASARVVLPEDLAWRVLATRRRPPGWRQSGSFEGPDNLVAPWETAIAVMA